jgi:hypothetical protein
LIPQQVEDDEDEDSDADFKIPTINMASDSE